MTNDEGRLPLTRRGVLALGGTAIGGAAVGGQSLVRAQDDDDGGDDTADDDRDDDYRDDDRDDDEAGTRHYRVTVANLTPGQPFTPPAVAAHTADVEVFGVGDPANEATRQVAENGNLGPLTDLIESTDSVRGAAVGETPLVPKDDPGDTGNPYFTTLTLSADADAEYLTFISMLVATNDGIVGLDTVPLPSAINESRTYYANGYDVGTERNTERFEDMVPPAQALILGSAEGGTTESDPALATDDVIRPHPGIEGDGDLDPAIYGWREPAGLVVVERIERVEPEQREFSATLRGDEEVPPVDTDASGEATFSLDEAGDELDYEVTVSNIENVTAAHIHCGAAGENGPVGVTLYGGDTVTPDGRLVRGTVTEPDGGNGCGWTSLDDVLAAIRSGDAYVNVHTEANPAGEIRGQVG